MTIDYIYYLPATIHNLYMYIVQCIHGYTGQIYNSIDGASEYHVHMHMANQ